MRWRRIAADEERAVRDFLTRREAKCAAGAARFREIAACGFGSSAPGKAWAAFREAERGQKEPASVLIAMKSGVVSVLFDQADDPANERALSRLLPRLKVSSIQGLASDVAVAERVISRGFKLFAGKTVVDPIDYSLMALDGPPAAEALAAGPPGLTIRRAYQADAELLFPLQAAYELEEVVPKGGEFNAAAARLGFERSLRERTILYAVLDGKAVGKAGTNARAYSRDQIGGVFVEPGSRGRGIAARLVAELSALIEAEGRRPVLFVKRRNVSAQAAYRKVGFELREDYRITYYTEAKR